MIVYVINDETVIFASVRANHKQGRVPAGTGLGVKSDSGEWYELDQDSTMAIIEVEDPKRESDYTNYPNFYIEKVDVTEEAPVPPSEEPPLPPPVGEIADEQAAWHILMLLKWWKQ